VIPELSVAAGQNTTVGTVVVPSVAFAWTTLAGGLAIGRSATTSTIAVVVRAVPCSSAWIVTG